MILRPFGLMKPLASGMEFIGFEFGIVTVSAHADTQEGAA
jgi:hypothetical protein